MLGVKIKPLRSIHFLRWWVFHQLCCSTPKEGAVVKLMQLKGIEGAEKVYSSYSSPSYNRATVAAEVEVPFLMH